MAMTPAHKHVLNANRVRLVRELIPNEEFMAVLIGDYTLTAPMVEEIQSAKTTQGKAGKLLDVLPKRGDKAFFTFIKALKESHQDHLVSILEPSSSLPSENRPYISQPADNGTGGKFNPTDTTSFGDEKGKFQPSLPIENKQKPLEESSGTDNSGGRSVTSCDQVVGDVIALIEDSAKARESFIYSKFSCSGGTEPGITEHLKNGRCLVCRLTGPKPRGSLSYDPTFDDVNLSEAFKKFAFAVPCAIEERDLKVLHNLLQKEAETEASALIFFLFASSLDDHTVGNITELFQKSSALKGKPKVLIYQVIESGDVTDSTAEPYNSVLSSEFSCLNINPRSQDIDNLAVLRVVPSKGKLETKWLVWSFVILLMKYSKAFDLSTMLKHIANVLKLQSFDVRLECSLKDGLYLKKTTS